MKNYESQVNAIYEKAAQDAQALASQTIYAKPKKREFSKTLVIIVFAAWAISGLFCLISWALTGDMPIAIFQYTSGILAAVLGYYYAKAGYQNGKAQIAMNDITLKTLAFAQTEYSPNTPMDRGENI